MGVPNRGLRQSILQRPGVVLWAKPWPLPNGFITTAHNKVCVKVEIDPDAIQKRPADSRGRVYLGAEYANKQVEVVVLDHE